ncbi:MAG TPA: anti-sigma factor [Terriglobia bacterium]|nr:anti-sigma factor [Terriglobia bacterium]
MNCEEMRRLTHAFLDRELDLVRSMEIETHLESCAGCLLTFQKQQSLKSLVHSSSLYYRAPDSLEHRIRAGLREARDPSAKPEAGAVRTSHPRQTRWSRFPTWSAAAAAFAVMVLTIVFLAPRWFRPSRQNPLAEEVVSSHIRSLMPNHLTDVVSSDQHTVKPWFDGRLDFSPSVIDLAREGFPLAGGRLDYLGGRPVAALVYQRRKHLINVFTWPDSASSGDSGAPVRVAASQGYNVYHWTRLGMVYWAVSDLNTEELSDFVRLLRNAS